MNAPGERLSSAIIVITITALSGTSAADGLVVESRVGNGEAAVAAQIETVKQRLASDGFRTSFESPKRDDRPKLSDVSKRLKAAKKAYFDSNHSKAIQTLTPLIREMQNAPHKLSELESIRTQLFNALVLAAIVQRRLKDDSAAKRAMETLELSFPDRKISRADYGSEPGSVRRKVARELNRAASATLNLTTSAGGALYINGEAVGHDQKRKVLRPGTYWVFASKHGKAGDAIEIHLAPGATRDAHLEIELLSTLKREPRLVLEFASTEDQQRELDLATRVAELAKARRVIVLSVRTSAKGATLHGTLMSSSGEILRDASLSADASSSRAAEFADILAGKRPAWIRDLDDQQESQSSSLRTTVTWSLIGCGIGAGTGGAAILTSGVEGDSYRNQGIGLAVVGGACLAGAASVFLWSVLSDDESAAIESPQGSVSMGSGAGVLGWSTRF